MTGDPPAGPDDAIEVPVEVASAYPSVGSSAL